MLVFLFFVAVIIGIYFSGQVKVSSGPAPEKVFVVQKGDGFLTIASNLKKEGLIKSKTLFEIHAVLAGVYSKMMTGRYSLSPSMSIEKILDELATGDIMKQKITILEGWDLNDIANQLAEKGISSQQAFYDFVCLGMNQPSSILKRDFDFLREKENPEIVTLEGYLFPDTYEFSDDASLEDILRRMLENFHSQITKEMKNEIKRQDKTLYQVLIMASLLDREVRTYQDKQIVAGILWKRLEADWPLQVDASENYVVIKPNASLCRLGIDSTQYDTYKYKGLPPGPICNPGLEGIKAAIYYKESPYWYYLSKPNGETVFSETFEEHKIAKARYLKYQNAE